MKLVVAVIRPEKLSEVLKLSWDQMRTEHPAPPSGAAVAV